jgi:hypothetical protein
MQFLRKRKEEQVFEEKDEEVYESEEPREETNYLYYSEEVEVKEVAQDEVAQAEVVQDEVPVVQEEVVQEEVVQEEDVYVPPDEEINQSCLKEFNIGKTHWGNFLVMVPLCTCSLRLMPKDWIYLIFRIQPIWWYTIGGGLSKILRICAVSFFPVFSTRVFVRKEST